MTDKQLKLKNDLDKTVEWLKNYAINAGNKSLVIGVSGGVDSALCSTLCAMTGLTVHTVVLPCHSQTDGLERAEKHIDWLCDKFSEAKIKYHHINLTDTFSWFKVSCGFQYDNDLGYANAKSRFRMVALYQIATVVNGLVVGTGNKVEDFGVGFFTKYGDGGVDISPIADYYKSEVREAARILGILPELSEAVSTDGLWEDLRDDETQLGATYDELEWAMELTKDSIINFNDLDLNARQREVLEIYLKRHAASKHKLLSIPTFKRT